jgi:hypothetical protein
MLARTLLKQISELVKNLRRDVRDLTCAFDFQKMVAPCSGGRGFFMLFDWYSYDFHTVFGAAMCFLCILFSEPAQ